MKKFLLSINLAIILLLSACSTISNYYNPSAEITTSEPVSPVLRNEINRIISQNITSDMSEYDIAKILHDYIVINTEFDSENLEQNTLSDSVYTAKGALIDHLAVCQGYSEAYLLLTTAAGLECKIISGTANGDNHAWNIVKIDGKWYNVDVTWDDPTNTVKTGTANLKYNYFLIPDSVMYQDHKPDGDVLKCTSDTYLYDIKEYGAPFVILDSIRSIPNYYMQYYRDGKHTVTFYFPTCETELSDDIINETASKLATFGINVSGITYTPIIKLDMYNYTTITFE